MAGPHTLAETERQVNQKLVHKNINFEAMAVTSNLFRAANAVRNQERSFLDRLCCALGHLDLGTY
jgi:hypothetical protein